MQHEQCIFFFTAVTEGKRCTYYIWDRWLVRDWGSLGIKPIEEVDVSGVEHLLGGWNKSDIGSVDQFNTLLQLT